MGSRDKATDSRRVTGGPQDRGSYMMSCDELIEPHSTGEENVAGHVVGVNAPVGGLIPQTYVVGGRGGPIKGMSVEDAD
jgi:hypothetical protein